MKKLLLLAFLATMMVGCDKKMPDGTYRNNGYSYRTYIIDSCEYFGVLDCGNGNFLTHKGNCRFCAERNRRIIREQVDSILTEIYD